MRPRSRPRYGLVLRTCPSACDHQSEEFCTGAASLTTPSWHCNCNRLLTALSSCSAV